MMRRIGIIARSLGLYHGGVYRYVFNILHELDQKVEEGSVEISIIHNETVLRGKFPHCREIYIPLAHTYRARLLFDYVYSVHALKQADLDYIIYPKNIIPVSHYVLRAKKLPTILDLGHFEKGLHAYKFWDTLYARALIKPSCARAYKILTISHSTKQAMIEKLHLPPEKIQVAHLGIEARFQKTNNHEHVIEKFHLRRPFVFYNGSITPRKNLMRVLEAFQAVQHLIPHTLYMTGSLTWGSDHIHDYIENHLAGRVVKLGYIEEHDLVALYNLADLFLYPSLYEGFGLPILEAQACGCPVLTSNTTSCPEVAGAGAHLVNPYSVEEIQAGILKILQHDDYRQQLIERGFENITRFHWQKTAEDILAACQ
ncbi:MAG: glycosyltransferase family 1 protein [Candidatus Vecturithrix sp.]|jgi:glycosyltransferase involved in cell wall biosynthesis|nr:glycosyltransferase family 1 protein [Candidatus Vecturithrix sp.]